MIRVLMCGNHPTNKGGMTSVIEQILDYDWKEKGIMIKFMPTFFPGNNIQKGIYFIYSYFRILFSFIMKKPDIVHMHMSYRGSFSRKYMIHKICKLFHVPDVVHLHGSEFESWYIELSDTNKKKVRQFLSEVKQVIVLGKKWERIVRNIEQSTNIVVIPNCINIPGHCVQWNEEKFEFLFLGVLIKRKGIADLLLALKLMKEKRVLNDISCIIAGTGEQEDELKKLAKEYNVDDVVKFIGWISGVEKKKYLERCQALISPSYNEGLPVSILEACGYGMPIVTTDVGDIGMVVQNEVNGILFNPGDIDALINAMLYVSSKENYDNLSKASKEIINCFSIDKFYYKLEGVYSDLAACDK